jgi:hypothetical protein
MDILSLAGSAFAGGVSAIMLLYRLFPGKREFEKLEKTVEDMKNDYVTHKTLELMLARITDQLTNISDSLKSLTGKGKHGGDNE